LVPYNFVDTGTKEQILNAKQETQLSLTNHATRLEVSQGS